MTIDCEMRKETLEQPALLAKHASVWAAACAQARERIGQRKNIALVGRGSSGNACTFAAYLFGAETGRQPIEFRPWLCTQDVPTASWEDTTVLAYSASGQSTDIAGSAAWLRERGARTLAVTVTPDANSNLAQACDNLLSLDVGVELAVPATKSFTAQLVATAGLCGCDVEGGAQETAAAMTAIEASGAAEKLGEFLREGESVAFVARGMALAAAQDAALKLQEAVGVKCSAWSAAELLHGPIRAWGPTDRVVLLRDAFEGPTQSLAAVSTALLRANVPHMFVTPELPLRDSEPPHALGPLALQLPMPNQRWARTLALTFLAQLSTLWLAEAWGINPDLPPGLSKVTFT